MQGQLIIKRQSKGGELSWLERLGDIEKVRGSSHLPPTTLTALILGEAPVPLSTVGMVPSCLFNVISQNDAHGRCEQFQQLFPRAGVERL
jgi:hypothetical protein